MVSVRLVLLILAFVFFVIAATGMVPARINILALGLACWVLALLIA